MKGCLHFVLPLIAGFVILSSCNQDKDPPIITILGDNPLKSELGEPYIDPGASASDNEDGDLSAAIEIDNKVNPYLKGTYSVVYTVADESDNSAQDSRTVFIMNNVDFLSGAWEVADDKTDSQNNTVQSFYNETIVPSDSINGQFWVSSFGNHVNGRVYIKRVMDSQFEVQQQEVNCGSPSVNRRFMGTATVLDSNNIKVNYTEIVGSENYSGSANYLRR